MIDPRTKDVFSSVLDFGPVRFKIGRHLAFCQLSPNECSLHDGRIIHGAYANQSLRRRTGYTMRYISQTIKFIPEGNPGYVIWHACGRNVAGIPVVN